MARKSKFFTTKRGFKSTMLFLRGNQVASIWKDGSNFVCALVKSPELGEFKTFEEAEMFAWLKGV